MPRYAGRCVLSQRHLPAASSLRLMLQHLHERRVHGGWSLGDRPAEVESGRPYRPRAEMDVFWASSVCFWPAVVNGERPTPLRFEAYEGSATAPASKRTNPVQGRNI